MLIYNGKVSLDFGDGCVFFLEVVGTGHIFYFDGVKQVFQIKLYLFAYLICLKRVWILVFEDPLQRQDLIVHLILPICDVLASLDAAKELIMTHLVLLFDHREKSFFFFLAPFDLEFDEATVFGSADFLDQKWQNVFVGELVDAEVVEEALLTIDGSFLFELLVLVVYLEEQPADFFLGVVLTEFLEEGIMFIAVVLAVGDDVLQESKVLEVEGKHRQARF